MMHSGGGLMSVETAMEHPVRLLESGPAGGAIFAADYARGASGSRRRCRYDMGGTTAKICLIEDFAPKTARTLRGRAHLSLQEGVGHADLHPGRSRWSRSGRAAAPSPPSTRWAASRPGRDRAGLGARPGLLPAGRRAPDDHRCRPDARQDRPRELRGRRDPAGGGAGRAARSRDAVGGAGPRARARRPSASARWWTRTWPTRRASMPWRTAGHSEHFTMIAFGGRAPLHAARLCEKLGHRPAASCRRARASARPSASCGALRLRGDSASGCSSGSPPSTRRR